MSEDRVPGDVLLVGSLPFETAAESLTNGANLGSDVNALPDGEIGDRKYWTGYLPIAVYSAHPDLTETNAPTKDQPDPESDARPGAERAHVAQNSHPA